MAEVSFGLTFVGTAITGLIVLAYIVALLVLGWESHSKYGTGYYFVGGCLLGVLFGYFNYHYWLRVQTDESIEYPMWAMIVTNVFLVFLGLWAYLIYHAIFLRKSKAMRSGSRLEKRVFAEESAAFGTGRFRDQLKGWEGDLRLDVLIVEGKFDEAEDYLQGVIMTALSERDQQKARHYEQYKTVIQKERLEFDVSDKDEKKESMKTTDVDLKRGEKIEEEELPEGWAMPD